MSKGDKRRSQPHKGCEHQDPTVRVRVHTPEIRPVHHHLDSTFTVKKPTDYEAWAETCRTLLRAMGIVHDPLVIGFVLDFVNGLPVEIRRILFMGIFNGWGMDIEENEDDGSIYVKQVERYPPLAGEEKTKSGIILPEGTKPGTQLIIPGE